MRRPFIAGNWKMNLTRDECERLARGIAEQFSAGEKLDVAVCPPTPYLDAVGRALKGSAVDLGAQNMYHAASGAYTGETSGKMLVDVKCKYVVLGHSEPRHIMGETSRDVNRKVLAALEIGLFPIVCVGELLEERRAGQTKDVIQSQFSGSLDGLTPEQMTNVVIAYEPVWAIGTGEVATPDQAEEVHADLRKMLETSYNSRVASSVRIQYGGSVKPENAGDLLSQPNIDGALVGGASLKVDSFLGIIAAV
ncbi:MAG: triose-phosphate isomerase [Pirellulaceae bacterium]